MRCADIFILACGLLVLLATSYAETLESKARTTESCGLNCWLADISVTIPTKELLYKGFNMTIHDSSCHDITIGDLNSWIDPINGLSYNVSGVGIKCNLNWALSTPFSWLKGYGTIDATVSQSGLMLALELPKDVSTGLADSAVVKACQADVNVSQLEFSGELKFLFDIDESILNLFDQQIKDLIRTQLRSVACQQLKSIIEEKLSQGLQKLNSMMLPYMHPTTSTYTPTYPVTTLINLQTYPLLGLVDYVLDDLVGVSGTLGVNKIFDRVTNGTGSFGMENLSNLIPTFAVPVGDMGTLALGLHSFNVSGLSTWSAFELLEPSSQQMLGSHTRLENLDFAVEFFVNVSLSSGVISDTRTLFEGGILTGSLAQNDLVSHLAMALNDNVLPNLASNQVVEPGCLKPILYDLNMTMLSLNFTVNDIQLDAKTGDLEAELDKAVDDTMTFLLRSYKHAIPAFMNGLAVKTARERLNSEFQKIINMHTTCPAAEPVDAGTFSNAGAIASFTAALGLFALIVIVLAVTSWRCKKKMTEEEGGSLLVDNIMKLDDWSDALILDSAVPWPVRYGILFLLLVNIALYISSNTSVAASVYLVVRTTQDHIQLPSLFDFGLVNTIHDMWHAGVYPLSILICLFSGIWPYIKLVMLLVCWVVPVRWLTVKVRGRILIFLDALGKWSLIDSFVLVVMIVAFHFNVVPPVTSYTPAGSVAFTAYVEPHWGFYEFLIATMLSLGINNVVLGYHRKVTDISLPEHPEDLSLHSAEINKRETLWSHRFKSSKYRALYAALVAFSLFLSIGFVIAGSVVYSFQFEFKGAFGLMLRFLQEKDVQPYSLISLMMAVPGSTMTPNAFGVHIIQLTFFLFAFVVPLSYLVVLTVIWLTPLTLKWQKRMVALAEILHAWAGLEVFVISIIAALLELGQFAQFLIGNRCDQINPILQKYFGDVLHDDAQCFSVIATLESGCWFLFCGCAIYMAVGFVMIHACHKAVEERQLSSIIPRGVIENNRNDTETTSALYPDLTTSSNNDSYTVATVG